MIFQAECNRHSCLSHLSLHCLGFSVLLRYIQGRHSQSCGVIHKLSSQISKFLIRISKLHGVICLETGAFVLTSCDMSHDVEQKFYLER